MTTRRLTNDWLGLLQLPGCKFECRYTEEKKSGGHDIISLSRLNICIKCLHFELILIAFHGFEVP